MISVDNPRMNINNNGSVSGGGGGFSSRRGDRRMSFGLGPLIGPNIHLSPAAAAPSMGQIYGESRESHPGSVLRLVEDVCRVLRGARITSCKSAKDRTGMAVTLEESRLLAQFEAGVIAGTSMSLSYLSSRRQQQQQLVYLRAASSSSSSSSSFNINDVDNSSPPPPLIAAFLLRSVYAIPTGSSSSGTRPSLLTRPVSNLPSWPWPGKHSPQQWAGDTLLPAATTAAAAGAIASQKAILSQYFRAAYEGVSATWPSLGPSGSVELVSVAIGAQHSSRLAGFVNGTAAFLAEPAVRGYLGAHASMIALSRQPQNNISSVESVKRSIISMLYSLASLEASLNDSEKDIHSAVVSSDVVKVNTNNEAYLKKAHELRKMRTALATLAVQPLSMRVVPGDHGVRAAVMDDILGCAGFLREYGTRLSNAEKNTGKFAFAFNAFQRAFFPLEFRAPLSVIGSSKNS
jgi:hypothetical protein